MGRCYSQRAGQTSGDVSEYPRMAAPAAGRADEAAASSDGETSCRTGENTESDWTARR